MKRTLAALVALVATSAASAHFVWIVPDGPAAAKAKVIFSDSLKPDDRVNVEKIAETKLFVLSPGGKDEELKWALDKDAACYTLEVPGAGTRVVYGSTDYGVLQRGDSKPFRLHYHPKAIFGQLPTAEKATLGKRVALELVPIAEGGKLRVLVLASGQPLEKAEVAVMVPGGEKAEDVTTDDKGMTPAFDKPGQYGVRVLLKEAKSGEERGKKYEEVRHYATLVLHYGKPER